MKKYWIVIFALLEFAATRASAEDEPSATPYRPTVSTPANLSEPGWVELEMGGQRTNDGSSAHRDNILYALKYAFTPDWGVRVGGDTWVREVGNDGSRLSGFGDTAKDYDFRIEDIKTGAAVRVQGDRPMTRVNIFSIDRVQSVEPYIAIELAPGTGKSWSYIYTFTAPR